MPEEPIPHLASRRLDAHTILTRTLRHIVAVDMEFQIELARQLRNKFLIPLRRGPTQLVIEMDYREDNPQLAPQLEKQAQ